MNVKVSVGDALPSVGLRATDGYLLNLRSFVTKQPVLLLFFGAPTHTGAARRRRRNCGGGRFGSPAGLRGRTDEPFLRDRAVIYVKRCLDSASATTRHQLALSLRAGGVP